MPDNNSKAEDKEGLIKLRDDATVSGTLKIIVHHAKDIKKADSN